MCLTFLVARRPVAFCMILESLFLRSCVIAGNHVNFSLLLTGRKLTSETVCLFAKLQGDEWDVEETENYSISVAKKHLG